MIPEREHVADDRRETVDIDVDRSLDPRLVERRIRS